MVVLTMLQLNLEFLFWTFIHIFFQIKNAKTFSKQTDFFMALLAFKLDSVANEK